MMPPYDATSSNLVLYVDAQTLGNPEAETSVEDTLVAEQLAAEKKKEE